MVGPNPKFKPVAGYHWYDGDGMVHGLRIKDGKATYVSRYVRTSRLKQEEYFGEAKFIKIGDLEGLFGLLMGRMFHMDGDRVGFPLTIFYLLVFSFYKEEVCILKKDNYSGQIRPLRLYQNRIDIRKDEVIPKPHRHIKRWALCPRKTDDFICGFKTAQEPDRNRKTRPAPVNLDRNREKRYNNGNKF